jgi:hypothetical protein
VWLEVMHMCGIFQMDEHKYSSTFAFVLNASRYPVICIQTTEFYHSQSDEMVKISIGNVTVRGSLIYILQISCMCRYRTC